MSHERVKTFNERSFPELEHDLSVVNAFLASPSFTSQQAEFSSTKEKIEARIQFLKLFGDT
jgi:hypothetical protein